MSKAEKKPQAEASKYKTPKPELNENDKESKKNVIKWAASELGEEKAKVNPIKEFLQEAYGKEIVVAAVTVGGVRDELGMPPLGGPKSTGGRSSKEGSETANAEATIDAFEKLQAMLRESDYDTVKSAIEDVAELIETIGKAQTLRLLNILAGKPKN